MLRSIGCLVALSLCLGAKGAEKIFDFSQVRLHETPEDFRSTVTGRGKPGDWQVVLDRTLSAFPALPNKPPEYADQSVLAQLSGERIDERFPLLVYEGEVFDDFVLRTQVKMVGG